MSGDTADTTAESGGRGGGGAEPMAGRADGGEKLVGTREAARFLKAAKAICPLGGTEERQGLRSASV